MVGALATWLRARCYDRAVERDEVRRWQEGHQRAGRRALQVMRAEGALDATASFEAALELCALIDPITPDPVREREVAAARAAWAKVRAWAASRG